jgi:non-ribosomal peptide synthase protein (TIGR01720 family)
MLTDLQAHYLALEAGQPLTESRSSGFGGWVSRLSASDLLDREASYWNGVLAEPAPALPLDNPRGGNLIANAVTLTQSLDAEITRRLLQDAPAHYPVQINDLLLAALLLTMRDWSGQARLRIELESHGRPDLFEDIDLSRTVGWLTALYPVLLEAEPGASIGNVLLAVKNTLRSLPHDGIGYGVLRYLHGRRMAGTGEPVAVRFNYLGQTDNLFTPGALFTPSGDPAGPMHGAANPRDTVFDINALVSGGRLHVQWTYSAELHRRETVAALAAGFNRHLAALADHCLTADDAGYTPADFALMDIDQGELDDLLSRL